MTILLGDPHCAVCSLSNTHRIAASTQRESVEKLAAGAGDDDLTGVSFGEPQVVIGTNDDAGWPAIGHRNGILSDVVTQGNTADGIAGILCEPDVAVRAAHNAFRVAAGGDGIFADEITVGCNTPDLAGKGLIFIPLAISSKYVLE